MPEVLETPAPSAGVETAAPPTATVDEVKPGEVQPETEIPSPTDEVIEQPDEEPNLDETPGSSGDFEAYKPLFKEHPDLRNILGREKAFSEIAPNGSFYELKQIVERVPSLEDAEALAVAAENHRNLGEIYRKDPVAFTESLRENDPFAFSQLATKLPEILAQTDPRLYRDQAEFYTNAVLDNLYAIAQQSKNEEALTAIQNVAQMLGARLGQPRMAAQPGNSEVERLKRQLQERDQEEMTNRAVSFWDSANDEYAKNASSEIEGLITKSIPDVTEAQLSRMAAEVWEKVNQRLGTQPQTMAQIENFKKQVAQGRMSPADYRAIVDFSTRRAKQMIPLVWKEVSSEWSKQVLAFNQKQIEKKKGIAQTTAEVSPATAPSTTGTRTPRTNPIQAPKRSFSTVFNELRTGTYQPRR